MENNKAFIIRNKNVIGLQEKMGVTLSQEAYDALSDEKKNDGTIYFIPDGDGEIGIQDTIISENSVWSSQKVSDEIAEVESKVDGLISDTTSSTTSTWSSKKTSDEIAKKVDKTDIATTIDGTSTDTQVPSAKAVWDTCQGLCSKTVADVPSTAIVSEVTEVSFNNNCLYTVINGICYVSLWGFRANVAGQHIVNSSMPKAKTTMQGMCTYGHNGDIGACAFIFNDNNVSKLYVEANTINESLYGSFSYPVAES